MINKTVAHRLFQIFLLARLLDNVSSFLYASEHQKVWLHYIGNVRISSVN
jgi:hypothetical protein